MTALRLPCSHLVPQRLATVAVVVLCVGCGGPPQAVVRGTVTLDGKPLAAGLVILEADGRSYSGPIGPDGRYELRNRGKAALAPGTYGVAVLPPEPEVVADPKTTALRAVNPVDQRLYPQRYRSAATSGISRTVAAGESTFDVELTAR